MKTDVVEQSSIVALVLQCECKALPVMDDEAMALLSNLGAAGKIVSLPTLPVVVLRIEVGCPAAPLSTQV